MSRPFKLLQLQEKVVSIAFEEKLALDGARLKLYFMREFPSVEEVSNTFNRINLFFKKAVNLIAVNKKLADFDVANFTRKSSEEYWEIPICLDPQYTADLFVHFEGKQSSVEDYLAAFLAHTYTLEFYGFLPGFGYMSGLPKNLHLPRKQNPTRLTNRGTVAVGGAQLGVYPQDSPGGWQGIGYTPVPWFIPKNDPPVFISSGDQIRFTSIDTQQCRSIALAVELGVYQPKKIMS